MKTVGAETFRICNELVDDMVTVSTDEICAAIKDGFMETRCVLEPAGALAIAGLKKWVGRTNCRDLTLVATASGANMDFDRLRFVSERADSSETMLSVLIPEQGTRARWTEPAGTKPAGCAGRASQPSRDAPEVPRSLRPPQSLRSSPFCVDSRRFPPSDHPHRGSQHSSSNAA